MTEINLHKIENDVIVFKNRKLIPDASSMKDMVGWEDTYYDYDMSTDRPIFLHHSFKGYIGDKRNVIAFYNDIMTYVQSDADYHGHLVDTVYFQTTPFHWRKWRKEIGGNKCTVTKRNGYFVCKWKCGNDKYKVYFGYGVDLDLYKAKKIVNFNRSIYRFHLKNS